MYNSATGDTVSMTYDAESRMISASDSASTFSDTYSYNGLDQRVGKVDNTGTFAYTRDGDDVADDVLADGAATYNYGDNGNAMVSEVRGSTSKYYKSDGLGSTTALTNSSESVTDTHVTDAFGNCVVGSGSTPTPFGFVGQGGYQSDSDTGLTLCGHRYYDSSIGRFLSRDPAQSGRNWYTYCGNDSADNDDPTGLDIFIGGPKDTVVSLTQANEVFDSFAYLEQTQIGNEVINHLQDSSLSYYITFNNDDNDHFEPNHVIDWDPTAADEVVNNSGQGTGQYQSPALGLLHELGHGYMRVVNLPYPLSYYDTPDPLYDDLNEKWVITNIETPAGVQLGEPTRTNHDPHGHGRIKRVSDPTQH